MARSHELSAPPANHLDDESQAWWTSHDGQEVFLKKICMCGGRRSLCEGGGRGDVCVCVCVAGLCVREKCV